MKAMVLNSYGPEAQFETSVMPDPVAPSGHVVVKVAATSVNTVDTMIRTMGADLPLSPALPAVLGMDFAGTIVALGDSFHRAHSHVGLPDSQKDRLRALTERHRWIWIAGNHDPDAPDDLGGEAHAELELGPLVFRHEPKPGLSSGEIAGHLHPAAKIRVRGRAIRRRCFAASTSRLVMPALGAYAGGLNVLDPAFAFLFPCGRFHAWMIGTGKVYPIAPRRLAHDGGGVFYRELAARSA